MTLTKQLRNIFHPNNKAGEGGILIKEEGDPTDNLNINKQPVQIKGGSENCSQSKVATRYH